MLGHGVPSCVNIQASTRLQRRSVVTRAAAATEQERASRYRHIQDVPMRSLDFPAPGPLEQRSPGASTVMSWPVKRQSAARETVVAEVIAPAARTADLFARRAELVAEGLAERDAVGVSGRGRDIKEAEFRWSRESYSSAQRSVEIWAFIVTLRARLWLLDRKWSYGRGGYSEAKKSVRLRAIARYTREAILQLGPTFIKVGQLFSTRSDLFPLEFTEELSQLQDQVPSFPPNRAAAIVERELGAPLTQLFRSFDMRPIAAASLGQVHRAVLHNGQEVVVKVQRPALRALFDIDLANLKLLAELLDRGDPLRDTRGIYEECATILYQEIDYIAEGRNADRFRRNFQGSDWVRVPTVFWRYTSPQVITLQYLPGTKISDVAALAAFGLDAGKIARRATESYLIQVLRHGFLHSDPHPGNIAIDASGALLFYDFGMMSEVAAVTRQRLLDLFYGVISKDARGVMSALQDLGILVPTSDTLSLERTISYFLDNLTQKAERQETIANIGEDLFAIAVDQPFRFPAAFTFVLRAFSTLEGLGRTLDKDYSFAAIAQPYGEELLSLKDLGSREMVTAQMQRQAVEFGSAAAAMPGRVAQIEGVTRALERGDLKLRVRVLEAERSDKRASILQMATVQSVAAVGLLNVGTQLSLAGKALEGNVLLLGAAGLAASVAWAFRRVGELDKFEKALKSKEGALR